jgi:hypothetical protein
MRAWDYVVGGQWSVVSAPLPRPGAAGWEGQLTDDWPLNTPLRDDQAFARRAEGGGSR